MNRSLRVLVAFSLAGAGVLVMLSCGSDETTTAPCTNCEYWQKAFGRQGRFPVSCPGDTNLIAYCDMRDTADVHADFYHIWIAKLPEFADETTRFYQITSGRNHDLRPVWSPDGSKIAFERGELEGARDVFVVEVCDTGALGDPVRFTDNTVLEESNTDPAWVVMNGTEQWICFANSINGGADFDLFRLPYPGGGAPVRVTFDPADFAVNQNGVLGFIFKDKHCSSNGSNIVVFSSPDRTPVGNILVMARTQEQPDSTQVSARVFINGKDSQDYTPAVFEYRPVQDSLLVEGVANGYCSRARVDFFGMVADETTEVVLDFVHTHGTLAVSSIPGTHDVSVATGRDFWPCVNAQGDTVICDSLLYVKKAERTPDYDPEDPQYTFYTCINPDSVWVRVSDPYGPCGPELFLMMPAGSTLYVTIDCQGNTAGIDSVGPPFIQSDLGRRPRFGQPQAEPYSLWAVDVDTDALYLIAQARSPISSPALSPDGRYVAYIRGEGRTRELVVSWDVQAYIAGTAAIQTRVIALPAGAPLDLECYRIPERVSWINTAGPEPRVLVSMSVCGGGDLNSDFEVWIGEVAHIID